MWLTLDPAADTNTDISKAFSAYFLWSSTVGSIVQQGQSLDAQKQCGRIEWKKPRVEWNREEQRKKRVEKNTGPASQQCVCVCVGTSDRLVSALTLFHCGLWQL